MVLLLLEKGYAFGIGAEAGLALNVQSIGPHEAAPAFRRIVVIGERGISIPLPPPSVLADVSGTLEGEDPVVPGTVLYLQDARGNADLELDVEVGASEFQLGGVALDPTDNCLTLWLEAPGEEGELRVSVRTYYRAVAEPNGALRTVAAEGCE